MDWRAGEYVFREEAEELYVVQRRDSEFVHLLDRNGETLAVRRDGRQQSLVPFESTAWKKNRRLREAGAETLRVFASDEKLPEAWRIRAAAWAHTLAPSGSLAYKGDLRNLRLQWCECSSVTEALVVLEWAADQGIVMAPLCRELVLDSRLSEADAKRPLVLLERRKLADSWWARLSTEFETQPPSDLEAARIVRLALAGRAPKELLRLATEARIEGWLEFYRIASRARARGSRAELDSLREWGQIIRVSDKKFCASHAKKTAADLGANLFGPELYSALWPESPGRAVAIAVQVSRSFAGSPERREFIETLVQRVPSTFAGQCVLALATAGEDRLVLSVLVSCLPTNRISTIWAEAEKNAQHLDLVEAVIGPLAEDLSGSANADEAHLVDDILQRLRTTNVGQTERRRELLQRYKDLKIGALTQIFRPAMGSSPDPLCISLYVDDAVAEVVRRLGGDEYSHALEGEREALQKSLEQAQQRIDEFGSEQAQLQAQFERRLEKERETERQNLLRLRNQERIEVMRVWCRQTEDWSVRHGQGKGVPETEVLAQVVREAESRLEEYGIVPFGARGDVVLFDPERHQVVGTIEGFSASVAIRRRGYLLESPGSPPIVVQPALVSPIPKK